ncbi:quinone oxidoreductase family protein [Jongsikchunia kroppenstedtii]|uniref:quinone oxidoreductase family protein n=1 Tax=Jongsikchunia kroppenstedtii TaxID=1121721 RepID=UPI000382EBF6|nr:zinc-binding dehydrogenase [Jongsikchunia kroppenstedtii]
MKAAVADYANTPRWQDIADPEPLDGHMPVRMSAVAIHNLARGVAAGAHYSSPADDGFVIGVDGVGRTDDGARVYFNYPGTVAEQVYVPAAALVPIPDGLTDEQAAAVVNAAMSSWMAMRVRTQVRPGQTVLVLGATGASGRLAVPLARHLGARVIAAGRNQEILQSLNADATVDLRGTDDEIRAALHREKIDLVIDYVWGHPAELTLESLAKRGPATYVEVGAMAGATVTLPAALLRSTDVTILGSGLGSFTPAQFLAERPAILQAAVELGLTVDVTTRPAAEIADAWSADLANSRLVLTL